MKNFNTSLLLFSKTLIKYVPYGKLERVRELKGSSILETVSPNKLKIVACSTTLLNFISPLLGFGNRINSLEKSLIPTKSDIARIIESLFSHPKESINETLNQWIPGPNWLATIDTESATLPVDHKYEENPYGAFILIVSSISIIVSLPK